MQFYGKAMEFVTQYYLGYEPNLKYLVDVYKWLKVITEVDAVHSLHAAGHVVTFAPATDAARALDQQFSDLLGTGCVKKDDTIRLIKNLLTFALLVSDMPLELVPPTPPSA
jgi:hypothetical protein